MGKTRSFVTTDPHVAERTATFWRNVPGQNVVTIGPTGSIELHDAANDQPLWKSEMEGPWYMVISTPDVVHSTAGKGND